MAERVIVTFQQQERHFNERKDTIVDAPAPPPAAATNDEDATARNTPTEKESVHPVPGNKIPDHTDIMTPNTERTKNHTDKMRHTDKQTLDTNEISDTDTLIPHSSKFIQTDKIIHTDKRTPNTTRRGDNKKTTQDSIHLIEWDKIIKHNKPKHRKQRPRIKYPLETKENE